MTNLLYPAMNFVKERSGLIRENGDIDVLADLLTSGQVPVNIVYYRTPDGELNYTCEYTDNLDKIYDWYCSGN